MNKAKPSSGKETGKPICYPPNGCDYQGHTKQCLNRNLVNCPILPTPQWGGTAMAMNQEVWWGIAGLWSMMMVWNIKVLQGMAEFWGLVPLWRSAVL